MSSIVTIAASERKVRNVVELRRAVGRSVVRSRDALVAHFPLATSAESQYIQARQVALNVLAGCCEVDGQVTVRELYEMLNGEGR
jgi:hypothetical protein